MNKGVFWAVLAALLVFSSIVAVRDGLRSFFVNRAVNQALNDMHRQSAESAARYRRQAQQRRAYREARRRADLRARTLAPDQQCVSGTVVTVRPNYANQVLKDGRPVRCKGRLAETPLR